MGKPCNRSNADNSQPTQIHCTEPVEASGPVGQAVKALFSIEQNVSPLATTGRRSI